MAGEGSEVGVAYVSLVPSARNFSKLAQREIEKETRGKRTPTIRVTPKVDASHAEAQIAAQFTGGRAVRMPVDARVDRSDLLADTRRAVRAVQATNPTIHIDSDVDKDGLLGKDGKSWFMRSLLGLGGLATSLMPKAGGLIGVALATAVVVNAAPVIAAGVVSALTLGVGGGLLGLGVLVLSSNKRIQKSYSRLGARIKYDLAQAASPLVGPLVTAAQKFVTLSKELRPQWRAIFAGIAPIVPLIERGLSGFLRQLLPGLRAAVPGINAAFRGLASVLPGLGRTLGALIGDLTKNPKVIENTTRALFGLVTGPLKLLGPALSGLNVLFGVQTNLSKLMRLEAFELWPKLVSWFDSGTGAVGRLREAWNPLWTAINNVWTNLKLFAEADTHEELRTRLLGLATSIKDAWNPLKTFLGAVWGEAWGFVKRKWNEIVVPWWNNTVKPWLDKQIQGVIDRAFKAGKDKAVAQMKGLGPAVLRALASVPGMLYNAGRNMMGSLIGGILSRIAGVGAAVGQAAQKVRDFWPFSPAKEGPLSGHGSLFYAGQNLVGDLTRGMGKGLPAVRSASSQLAGAIGFGTSASALAPVGTAGAELGWRPGATGDPILDALRGLISAKYYGDPVKALGSR